jgi:hypothetical protein
VGLAAVAYPAAARPAAPRKVRKPAAAARKAPAPVPQEVLAQGFCRFVVRQGTGDPLDEVRFRFRSADLALPRRNALTPILAFREYLPDLPEGAPEIEQLPYDQQADRFDVIEEGGAPGASGPERWARVQATAGLPPSRETEVLGLPWLLLSAPRAGQSWERTEALPFPRLRERFRYQVVGMTSVGGRRAWRVERTLAVKLPAQLSVRELQAPAGVTRWQETFWVDADGRSLLRAERHLRLATTDETPVELTLDVEWTRKGTRPVAVAEYRARTTLFAKLTSLETKVQEASSRTTLDGASDLRALKNDLDELRESYADRRYQATFDRVDHAIDGGLQHVLAMEQSQQRQGRAAAPFTLPDAQGRPTTLASFRGKVVLLSFWSAS